MVEHSATLTSECVSPLKQLKKNPTNQGRIHRKPSDSTLLHIGTHMIRNSQHLNDFDLGNSLFTKSKKIKITNLKPGFISLD